MLFKNTISCLNLTIDSILYAGMITARLLHMTTIVKDTTVESTYPSLVVNAMTVLNNALPPIKSTYPYTKLYNQLYRNAGKHCPGYLCDYSGLRAELKKQILSAHNHIREGFAKSNNIANVYKLNWDEPLFTRHSQIKAAMCLPDTTNSMILIDENVTRYWFHPGSRMLLTRQAVEIVIASRQSKKNYTSPTSLQESLISYYVPLINSKEFLLRTHTATVMGCGYMSRDVNSVYMDHLVCTYGMLFTQPENRATVLHGSGCTRCSQYTNVITKNSTVYNASWFCDTVYSHLCTDNRDFYTPIEDSVVTCNLSSNKFSSFFFALSIIIIVIACCVVTAVLYFIYKQ